MTVLLVFWLGGCSFGPEIPSGPIIHEHDQAVRDEPGQGLDLKILSFSWRYLKPTDQIKVTGRVENLTRESLQGCRIIVNAFDQYNYPLGQAETYLNPTYLAPGSKARFEFFLHRGEWVKALRLRYRFEIRF